MTLSRIEHPNLRQPVPLLLPEGPFYVGLLGEIGAGKSTVAEEFARLGAGVLAADPVVHQLLDRPEVRSALEQKWGRRVIDNEGKLDKARIAELVFGPSESSAENLRFLEDLLHPRVAELLSKQAFRLAEQGYRVVVIDAPLLVEVGWHTRCHLLVYVESPLAECFARLKPRGWSWSELARRRQTQIPAEIKKQLAHAIIDNSGRREDLRDQVVQIWRTLIDPAASRR